MAESERGKKMKYVRNRQTKLSKINSNPVSSSNAEKENRLISFLTRHKLDQSFEEFKK